MPTIARILVLSFALVAGAAAAQPVRGDNIESELVAATDAAVPGQPLQVALRLKHDAHWHTYWQVPGDSGLPTQIRWQLPAGWRAGPIEWPVPQRFPVGPLMNFGYEGEVLLLTTLTPPAGLAPGGNVEFAARADWLICKDVCIPGGADLKLILPVRETAGPSRRAAQFAATRGLIPRPVALDAATATIEEGRIRFAFKPRASDAAPASVEFFPLEEARIEPAAPQTLRREGDGVALYLTAAQPVVPEFKTLNGVLVVDGGPARADRGGWAGIVSVPLAAGSVPVVADAAPVEGGASVTFWVALAGAFVGGLILNLMPCVFPVLSLKLLGLVQHQRAEDAAHVAHPALRTHGLVYAGGVIASFVALAAVLIALRAAGAQLGWGFQLQTPWVVAALTGLFFLIGLNLLGAFEFTWGTALANARIGPQPAADRLSGSFGTGVLAVIVAAPCTAPFMGAALGYAITQPAPVALAVFAMLGIGMAAPYVALTVFPQLLARLPRPGAWMERFKQVMAFPMFATCVWLVWVLAQQVDVDAVGLLLLALVLLGLAAWAFGLAQRGAQRYRWVALGAALLAAYATVSATGGENAAPGGARAAVANDAAQWQPWSRAALAQAIAAGKPVFVDFTAAWCVTCQANKRLVLNAAAVQNAFGARGVALMRADWTNRDPEITQELARFNRNGVPLYVLYDGKGGAQVLPELLTERTVLEALARL
ncbi:MAG: thioredoxin family protein [Burkholderiaceae bacterium]